MTSLDPILASWRKDTLESISSLDDNALLAKAKGMSSAERIATWDKYRLVKAWADGLAPEERDVGKLSIKENRWVLTLLATDRAEAVRARASSAKAAKEVKQGSITGPLNLESLI